MTKNGNASLLPRKLRQLPPSEAVPVLNDQSQKLLVNLTLSFAALSVGFILCGIGLILNAQRPVPDLVVDRSVAAKVQPLTPAEAPEPEMVVRSIEQKFPLLYTWVGLIPNPKDPTRTTFLKDPGRTVETRSSGSIKIPTSVWNEQYFLAEPIRVQTLQAIADLIAKTGQNIWTVDPNNPALGISYRFIFRGRPRFPEEVEPGRWKVIVQGDIVKQSPTLIGPPKAQKLQAIDFEVYVRRAGRNIPIHIGEDADTQGTDIVAHGKSTGFEVDAMIPFNPDKEPLPQPQ